MRYLALAFDVDMLPHACEVKRQPLHELKASIMLSHGYTLCCKPHEVMLQEGDEVIVLSVGEYAFGTADMFRFELWQVTAAPS